MTLDRYSLFFCMYKTKNRRKFTTHNAITLGPPSTLQILNPVKYKAISCDIQAPRVDMVSAHFSPKAKMPNGLKIILELLTCQNEMLQPYKLTLLERNRIITLMNIEKSPYLWLNVIRTKWQTFTFKSKKKLQIRTKEQGRRKHWR